MDEYIFEIRFDEILAQRDPRGKFSELRCHATKSRFYRTSTSEESGFSRILKSLDHTFPSLWPNTRLSLESNSSTIH